MQVDDLQAHAEDLFQERFAADPATAPAAWTAALALCGVHRHASSRLAHMCTEHLLHHARELLMCREVAAAVVEHKAVLQAALFGEVRDRLVALVALSDEALPDSM